MKRTMMTAVMLLSMTGVAQAADTSATTTTTTTTTTAATTMVNCGEKVKSMIPLPTKFEELMTAVSDNFSAHAETMSKSTDKGAREEAKAFRKLANEHRAVANQMKKIIKSMEAAGKLSAVPHDMSKPDPKSGDAMLNQAKLEREMAALMIKNADETEKQVATMKGATVKK